MFFPAVAACYLLLLLPSHHTVTAVPDVAVLVLFAICHPLIMDSAKNNFSSLVAAITATFISPKPPPYWDSCH